MAAHYSDIVFDLDGTLADTETAVLRTWRRSLADFGLSASDGELSRVLGVTTEDGIESLGMRVVPGFAERWVENYGLFCEDARLFDGVPEALTRLRASGFSLGVVSSRPREEYEKYFPGFRLERFVGEIVLADDTERHKPDPEPLLKYAGRAGAEPAACLYVGDAPTDVECAVRAGADAALAVWNGKGTVCPRARFTARSPRELCDLLLSE